MHTFSQGIETISPTEGALTYLDHVGFENDPLYKIETYSETILTQPSSQSNCSSSARAHTVTLQRKKDIRKQEIM